MNNISTAAFYFTHIQEQRLLTKLRKNNLSTSKRRAYLLELGRIIEMKHLITPYYNFLFYFDEAFEGANEPDTLYKITKIKALFSDVKRNYKNQFVRLGGTPQIPYHLIEFYKELQSNTPKLKSSERSITIKLYSQDNVDEPTDIYCEHINYNSISREFSGIPNSHIPNIVSFFQEVEEFVNINLDQPVSKIREQTLKILTRLDSLLN